MKMKRLILTTFGTAVVLAMAACEKKTETERALDDLGDKVDELGEKVHDGLDDAADARPGEKIRDAAEDLKDNAEDAVDDLKSPVEVDEEGLGDGLRKIGSGLKDVAREVATETGGAIKKAGEKIEEKANEAQRNLK
ncbi:MAG: hypothetical protein ACI9R3_004380 [Verrucomicrobiales bacterium]|jgi:hypothetical protein